MYDFSRELSTFHEKHVRLTLDQQADMRKRRNANCERVTSGLDALGKPRVIEWINQGGYAMKIMTQPPESDTSLRYDIDMGAVFAEEDAKTPATTKGWVRDAIAKKGTNLKNEPEAKRKCARVIYADGYQCDFPVFRKRVLGSVTIYEIAIGDEWIKSDPKQINEWFEREIKERSPDGDGSYQLRRTTRLVKYFAKVHAHRRKLKFPAGLVVTALAVECYQPVAGRDDEAFYETLRKLSQRSEYQPVFANGVKVSDVKDIDRIRRLVEEAKSAVEALDALAEGSGDTTDADARKAWKKVFRHSYFDEAGEAASKSDMEYKSALMQGAVASPFIGTSALAGISAEEKARRAEAAVEAIRETKRDSKPWSK